MLYDADVRLHKQMKHVILLNNIKNKISKLSNNSNNIFDLKEYKVFTSDKSKVRVLKSSFKPLSINNNYITIDVLENIILEDRNFLRFNAKVIDSNLNIIKNMIIYLY